MKVNISVLILPAVAATLLLAGCMSEPRESTDIPKGSTKSITFTLPEIKGRPATYVDAVGGENDLNYLNIFMFDGDTETLERVFGNDEIVVDKTSGPKPTATVDVTERSGDKEFFFVANGENITSELAAARFGETTIAQFLESVSDKQSTLPVTPLLMSGRSSLTAIENVATADPADLQVSLGRRVARFDIENDAAVTNFTIQKILIANVSKQAYIFEDATGTPARTIAKEKAAEIAFGTQADANSDKIAKSIFYTYPTKIGDAETEISFEGVFRNDPAKVRIFTLKPAQAVDILANKRYILKAKPITINEIEIELTVDDWADDSTEMEAKPGDNLISISAPRLIDGDGKLTGTFDGGDMKYDVTKATRESIIRFSTKSFRKSGSTASLTYLKGAAGDVPITINTPEPVITYGEACYVQEYEIKVGHTGFTPKEVEVLVEVVNEYDPIQTVYMLIVRADRPVYPASETIDMPGVLVGGTWFAPVNVGATTINKSIANFTDVGYYFQWGRTDSPFKQSGYATVGGPLNATNAANNKGKFITVSTAIDWLTPGNNGLWTGDNRRGPCPEGWRVPLTTELQKIVTAFNKNKTAYDGYTLKVTGDTGEFLYIPSAAEYINPLTGLYEAARKSYSFLWAADAPTVNVATSLGIGHNIPSCIIAYTHNRAYGFQVRCVLDE